MCRPLQAVPTEEWMNMLLQQESSSSLPTGGKLHRDTGRPVPSRTEPTNSDRTSTPGRAAPEDQQYSSTASEDTMLDNMVEPRAIGNPWTRPTHAQCGMPRIKRATKEPADQEAKKPY